MKVEVYPSEDYPLPGFSNWCEAKDRGGKRMSAKEKTQLKVFNDFLRKDFYFRNITQKKEALQAGNLVFEDDGVEKYVVQEAWLEEWMEQSKKLSDKCRQERGKEEKQMLDLEKKRKS
jgi:hypothetical protein